MKHCKICGDGFTTANRKICHQCYPINQQIKDPIEVCLELAIRHPERAQYFEGKAEEHRRERERNSVDYEREVRTNRRLAACVASIREHQPRVYTDHGLSTKKTYWCPRCGVALTRKRCIVCEMRIKEQIR